MAFLFKSKKAQDRALASREGPAGASPSTGAAARIARDEKGSTKRSTPTGSLNSVDNEGSMGSPDQAYGRQRAPTSDQQAQSAPQRQAPSQAPSDLPLRNTSNGPPVANNPNASLYPWSQRRLTITSSIPSPFPRYGAAVNSISSKEGDIYVMGGLINSSTVKGDLWMIEAGGSLACYPLATTAEGPGPRVGHASLLVGNAFIVYGGDTKIDETDVLDETLYLLNTSTRQWSRALPAGIRPSGRYGHSLNILGSKIYIFGGQVEGYFMNDLSAFDLNQLQIPNNRWEILIQDSGGPPQSKMPPARTNHTVITFNDRMYLFGGTNGFQWFNDVWCYDPTTNFWTELDGIGFVPVPREGHAAALVDDVMYIFGGRTNEGADLGDLAAFRITSRQWYTFQNMGPSPSARSGHSMTTVGKSIVIVGGEPSSAISIANDLALIYCLDTTKIRYQNDSQINSSFQRNIVGDKRPSISEVGLQNRNLLARDTSSGPPDARRVMGAPRDASANGTQELNDASSAGTNGVQGPKSAQPPELPAPSGFPPQGQPPQPLMDPSAARVRNASQERSERQGSPLESQSPVVALGGTGSPVMNGRRTPTQQLSRSASRQAETSAADRTKTPSQVRGQGSVDSVTEPGLKHMQAPPAAPRPASPPPPSRQTSNALSRRSSGRNSQTVALLKELDSARNRNAWYASELELARKSGYIPNATLSPIVDSRAAKTFDDEDKHLIEALLAMRTELANVQNSVDKQAVLAAKQIAEVEKQRDAAIQEAVYAKAKLAALSGSGALAHVDSDKDSDDRMGELGRKLAAVLNTQAELQRLAERLQAENEAERKACKLADDTSNAAQKRLAALESYKQQNLVDVERLKAELHLAQKEVREQSIAAVEAVAASEMLHVEKSEIEAKYNEAMARTKGHNSTFESLRAAVAASTEIQTILEHKLQEERVKRETAETILTTLKAEHESRTAELVATTQRLRDAEVLAEQHANEAQTHKEAILAGLDKISASDASSDSTSDSDRIVALQGQLNAANALVRKYQQEADSAADKLRSAEERIAGLEAYQEQVSREDVSIRRQLQNALKDTQSLQAANSDLKHQLASQQLETKAITVQHNSLKDILSERGISPTSSARARAQNSPRSGSLEMARLRELEQQLVAANAAQDEMRTTAALQQQESETAYREKLAQLENDYQSAVHYVKGTEKMLKQLKEQLARYKADNGRLKEQLIELEDAAMAKKDAGNSALTAWESQRLELESKIESLQSELHMSAEQFEKQLQGVRQELANAQRERDAAVQSVESVNSRLENTQKNLEQLQEEKVMVERRAVDAEQKVGTLLDQFEMSVDNYRRRSKPGARESFFSEIPATPGANGVGHDHTRQDSSDAGSVYGSNNEARNSAALDSLANELETLKSQWEVNHKNYRLSNTFDFESNGTAMVSTERGGQDSLDLSGSLADWRKRLDETHLDKTSKG